MQPRIGPNTRPNIVFAGLIAVLAIWLGWFAYDLTRLLGVRAQPDDYVLLGGLIALGLMVALAAAHLFRRPFGARAAISFTSESLFFESWSVFGRHNCFEIPRDGIAAFWQVRGPYTALFLVELTEAQAVATGRRLPSTEVKTPLVAAIRLTFPAHGFALPIEDVFAALQSDMAKAGRVVGPPEARFPPRVGRRYPVTDHRP